jgi:hypothetical protein
MRMLWEVGSILESRQLTGPVTRKNLDPEQSKEVHAREPSVGRMSDQIDRLPATFKLRSPTYSQTSGFEL